MAAALTAANAAETPGERAPDRGASHFVTVQDGLRLHVREYGARSAPGTPVVCLPGFTRTVADFDDLAPALAHSGRQRRVIAIDSRGRGQSEYDRNPAELQSRGRACRHRQRHDRARDRPGGVRRQLARRPSHHADERRASDPDRRRGAARYRPGDRAQGAGAHQELCRQGAATAQLRGGRRHPAPADERPVSEA